MISNCSHDEYGRYSGGKAGDQDATEYRVINWYNRPWSHVIRCTNIEIRKMIAQLAKEAADNDYIGYDQGTSGNNNDRYTFWQRVKEVGYRPSNIRTNCETDCSNSTAVIVKCVGYLLGIKELQNVSIYCYSGNIRQALINTGYFKSITDATYLNSPDYLIEGDILLYEGHHVAVNLTDGNKVNKYVWYETPVSCGIGGLKILTDELNVRKGPGKDYTIVDTLKKDMAVFPIGKAYSEDHQLWYHLTIGWVSGKYVGYGWIKEQPKEREIDTWWYPIEENKYYTLSDGEVTIDGKVYLFKSTGYLYVPADFDSSNYNVIKE